MSLSPKVGHTYVYQAQAGAPRMIRDIPEEDGQTSVDRVIPVPHAMLCLLQDPPHQPPPPSRLSTTTAVRMMLTTNFQSRENPSLPLSVLVEHLSPSLSSQVPFLAPDSAAPVKYPCPCAGVCGEKAAPGPVLSRFFGGLCLDIKRKLPWFPSDFYDGFHIQSISAILFIYLGCITNAITFGGLLGDATDNYQVCV